MSVLGIGEGGGGVRVYAADGRKRGVKGTQEWKEGLDRVVEECGWVRGGGASGQWGCCVG